MEQVSKLNNSDPTHNAGIISSNNFFFFRFERRTLKTAFMVIKPPHSPEKNKKDIGKKKAKSIYTVNADNPHNIAVLESNYSPRVFFFHLYELINLFYLRQICYLCPNKF